MNKKIPVWIDADTGVDDAMALVCALKSKELDVVGVSAVCGNVPLEDTFRNARDVLSLLKREDIKVYKGSDKPLEKPLHTAKYFHGNNGLGGVNLPPSKAELEKVDAWDGLYEKAKELDGQLVVIAIGPLTNIAKAIIKHPDLNKYVKKIAIMGGGIKKGNVTKYAEFNIFVDPEAARIVFEYDIEKIMCGLDVTHKAYITYDELADLKNYGNDVADLIYEATRGAEEDSKRRGKPGLYCHDVCPVFYLTHPEWFKGLNAHVEVITEGEQEGRTLSDIDVMDKKHEANTNVILGLNRLAFVAMMQEIYKNC